MEGENKSQEELKKKKRKEKVITSIRAMSPESPRLKGSEYVCVSVC